MLHRKAHARSPWPLTIHHPPVLAGARYDPVTGESASDGFDFGSMTEPTEIFRGSARLAAKTYPKNSNIAASEERKLGRKPWRLLYPRAP